jgi:NADH-quinone oxidoreductase subunit D
VIATRVVGPFDGKEWIARNDSAPIDGRVAWETEAKPAGVARAAFAALDRNGDDSVDEFEQLVFGNEIFLARCRGIGVIPAHIGAAYGVSGSNLRACGVDWDLRRDGHPYLVYNELDWKVWVHPDGDSLSRYWVRMQETRESARMCLQMLDALPAGPVMAKVPRIIKVPEGEVWVNTENPLGEMGYYIFSKGATGPFRTKIRSASFSNVSILPWLLKGTYVPDIVTILASLYFILGDIDR